MAVSPVCFLPLNHCLTVRDNFSWSNSILSFDLLDVAALDYLLKDGLVEKVFDIVFAILGSRARRSPYGFQALDGDESIRGQIVEKKFISHLGELPYLS